MDRKLLLATNNQGKVREYRALLKDIPVELVTPVDEGITTVVEETGQSFEDNAILKATALSAESGLVTLADDSGLEVDALDGEPGIRSARYAGENATDQDRVNYLLSKLKDVPREKRTARFRCVIAIATPAGDVRTSSGEVAGIIAFQPRGDNGFGYDPVFLLPALGKTMAELPEEIKDRISHRARAARRVYSILRKGPFKLFTKERGGPQTAE